MNDISNQQDYEYINLLVNNTFDNIINDLTNYKQNILNNIFKFIYINNNIITTNTNILEKYLINDKIYYIDNKKNIIYNTKENIVGEIKDKKINLYI